MNPAGIDPGIIHPLAISVGDRALLIAGRATRAEELLHLKDGKLRDQKLSRHREPLRATRGTPPQQGSRRWKKISAHQVRADAKDRRRARQASNRTARMAVAFVVDQGADGVVIGNPLGVTRRDSGKAHNRRVHRWSRPRPATRRSTAAKRPGSSLLSSTSAGRAHAVRPVVPQPRRAVGRFAVRVPCVASSTIETSQDRRTSPRPTAVW